MNRRFSGFVFLALLCFASAISRPVEAKPGIEAEQQEETVERQQEETVERQQTNGVSLINRLTNSNTWERWHASWSSNVVGAANYIDNFFGDKRLEEESDGTRLKLSLGFRLKEQEDPKLIHRANLRLSLPRINKRLQLVYEDLVESDDPNRPRDVLNDIGSSDPDAAIRYSIRERRRSKLDGDAGIRFGSPNQVFLRLRGTRRMKVTDRTDLRLTESVRWFSADGWVSTSEVQINRRMGWDWLFRSSSELEWAEEESGVRPSQTFSVFKTFSRRRALRFDIGGSWPETPNTREAKYFLSVAHRRLLHSNWLFFEVQPGVEFPQLDDYDPALFISVKLEMVLGKVD
ncbi:MAG TPA: hypothetical protein PKE26_05555 [Kiritimatiellia bacterium]|nr:hypothetical protein [Kiritimatiellia bacterium]HMO98559.1 hypothetical protein [Kiritimatiellia bacterium]HMP97569.1 hypothetical protein [Kiritimatiellia bacterium]